MKILIKLMFILSIFNLSAKTVFKCCGPRNCDLNNFKSMEECTRLCGGPLSSCQSRAVDDE